MVDNRAIAVFENRVETASLVCMPASKHEIFNADYQTRCRYYQEIFDFILQNRREKHEREKEISGAGRNRREKHETEIK